MRDGQMGVSGSELAEELGGFAVKNHGGSLARGPLPSLNILPGDAADSSQCRVAFMAASLAAKRPA